MEATMETTTDDRMRMFSADQIREFEKRSDQIRERMSPPGALGLPPHLERRRLDWGITDGAFDSQAAFDRVLVYQIPPKHFMNGTYGETSAILIPKNSQDARERAAPRGIIVSAGLKALDELESNGMDVGDIVMFNHVSPWRVETDVISGKTVALLVMHTGHLISSEDTVRRLRAGEIELVRIMHEGSPVHVYRKKNGSTAVPVVAAMDGEY